jgi:hypothetical protein
MKNIALIFYYILFIPAVSYSQFYHCPRLPMEYGKTWQYSSNDFADTLVSSIVDTAMIKGRYYYCFAPYGPNPRLPRYWLRPDPDQIFALNMQDTTDYVLFDFQAEINESWGIPPDSSSWNLPVNQCDWGSLVTLISITDSVINPNRLFINSWRFGHFAHPCSDTGFENTWFAKDFGIVRFSQVTEGGVLEWDLIVEEPDTTQIIGKYSIIGNPCLTVPCLPGIVSAVETIESDFVLERNGAWFWNDDFSWNGYFPKYGDSVIVTGIITDRMDIYGKQYFTIEILNFEYYSLTSVANYNIKNENLENLLKQNYPNPFNPNTIIEFSMTESDNIKIEIYDILGRLISELFNSYLIAGNYSIDFNASHLSSGIYYYRLSTSQKSLMKKMMLLK